VTPAAHYWMGGVLTDTHGRSTLPGLFAVGEVACTGVHGANRLASNSLLEAVVFGRRAASAAGEPWRDPELEAGDGFERVEFATPDPAVADPGALAELRELMWADAGLQRDATGLERAHARVTSWSAPQTGAVESLELRNLLEAAAAVTAGALARRESRGAHYRFDHPSPDPAFTRRISVRRKAPVPC